MEAENYSKQNVQVDFDGFFGTLNNPYLSTKWGWFDRYMAMELLSDEACTISENTDLYIVYSLCA